jgi:hypothetical protein
LRFESSIEVADAKLPNLRSHLDFLWSFTDAATDTAPANFGTLGNITIDAQIELGSFFDKFVRPIVDPVERILEPIRPVLKLLTQPIPGFNDISLVRNFLDEDGNGVLNLTDFILIYSNGSALISGFINVWQTFDELVTTLDALSAPGDEYITLGHLTIDADNPATNPRQADIDYSAPATPVMFEAVAEVTKRQQLLDNAKTKKFAEVSGSADFSVDNGSFRFNILQDEHEAFNLLLGRDATLFTWDLPELSAQLNATVSFPVFAGVQAELGGEISAALDLKLACDTRGLRSYFNGMGTVADIFLDGFFIPTDLPIVDIHAELFGGASVGQGLCICRKRRRCTWGISNQLRRSKSEPGKTWSAGAASCLPCFKASRRW